MNNSTIIFNKNLLRQQKKRAAIRFGNHNFLDQWADKQMAARLDIIKPEFSHTIYIGKNPDVIKNSRKIKSLTHICDTNEYNPNIIGDDEYLPLNNNKIDLILSSLSLHYTNDLLGALIQSKLALRPDGLFIGALLGGETLYELRDVLQQTEMEIYGGLSPRIAPFADIKTLGSLMQRADFALPVIDSEKLIVEYRALNSLYQDLRYMGQSNCLNDRNSKPVSKKFWRRAEEIYAKKYATEDKKFVATFEVIFLLGWKPHESQQKPLKPGSAEKRLADSLNTTETKL